MFIQKSKPSLYVEMVKIQIHYYMNKTITYETFELL